MNAGALRRRLRLFVTTALLCLLALAGSNAGAKDLPEGTHILAMVVQVITHSEIVSSGDGSLLEMLRANGISDTEITDGSFVVGIVYCCGGKISGETALGVYIPPEFRAAKGDIIEIALGRPATKKERKRGEYGAPNRALAVRESFTEETGACRWDPPNDALWMRVLYCDWMLGENWEYRGGLSKGWFRKIDPERPVTAPT